MAGSQANLGVRLPKGAQARFMRPEDKADCPGRQVLAEIPGGIPTMQTPPIFGTDSYRAVSACMIGQRQQPNLGIKRQTDSSEIKPCLANVIIQNQIRPVSNMSYNAYVT